MKYHEIDTKSKRYDSGSIRIEFYIKNNVEKDSQAFVSRISIDFDFSRFSYTVFLIFGQKKFSGDKVIVVHHMSRYVDSISTINSWRFVGLLVARSLLRSRS